MRYIKCRKSLIFVLLISCFLVSLTIFTIFNLINFDNVQNNTTNNEWNISNGYSLDVIDTPENGLIVMDDSTNSIKIEVGNIGADRDFVLKICYDYEDIDFTLVNENKYANNYFFKLKDSERKVITIKLPTTITKDNFLHKFMVSMYQSPNKYAKNNELTDSTGMSLVFDLKYDTNSESSEYKDIEYDKPKNLLKAPFVGILINGDIENEQYKELGGSGLALPEKSINVKRNELVKLTYNIGADDNINKYLFFVTLGWKQLIIDNHKYKTLIVESDKIGNGVFTFKAPDQLGSYDLVGYLIPNPFEKHSNSSFVPIEQSYRFTINVIE